MLQDLSNGHMVIWNGVLGRRCLNAGMKFCRTGSEANNRILYCTGIMNPDLSGAGIQVRLRVRELGMLRGSHLLFSYLNEC